MSDKETGGCASGWIETSAWSFADEMIKARQAGYLSLLKRELEALTVGDFAEITINGDVAAKVYFEKDSTKQSFVNEVNAVYCFIADDNHDDEVEVFLIKRTLIKTGHEFVLDEAVCHDFGEPKGQCAVCGGYCKGEVM